MRLIVAADATEAESTAAGHIADEVRAAIAARGRGVLALSRLPSTSNCLATLARADLDWESVQVVQVDERAVPAGDTQRNAWHLRQLLVQQGRLPAANFHAMPVDARDLESGACQYQQLLEALVGSPIELDVVHLGLGADGHTASLLPGDPVLEIRGQPVAFTQARAGLQRMTLTYEALDRARRIVWLVTGQAKAAALAALISGSGGSPAARVARGHATVIADRLAGSAPR